VAPTSLNEGRGEMVPPALVVVFHLGLKGRLLDGWVGGGVRAERRAGAAQPKCGNVPNAEGRKRAILGKGAKRDFP